MIVLSANLLNGRPAREAREGIDAHLSQHSAVVAFQEAGGYLPIIRDVAAKHGYRAPIAAKAGAGRGMNSSVLLIRKGAPVDASGVALSRAAWIGPRIGVRWPGRGIPWAVVVLDGERVLVASVHGPTGRTGANPLNRLAWRRYLRRLRRLARKAKRRHSATRVLYVGDWNCPPGARDVASVRRLLVDRLDLRIVDPDSRPHIDYAVTDLALTGEPGPRHGSDHDSTRYYRKAA